MMNKRLNCAGLLLLLTALSCSHDLEVLSVAREKLITINTGFTQIQFTSSDCRLVEGQWELRLIPQSSEYALYKRLTLLAQGHAGGVFNEFRFAVAFNVSEVNNMAGSYSYSATNPQPGLTVSEVTLLLRQGNTWTSYNLCSQPFDDFLVVIERQSVTERLVKGSFQGSLCLNNEPVDVSGQFKDIPY